ncbi:hypothetical protein [Streptomyces sp. NPDC007883]|uniref:hypothetical protein n=1 Tax=Streptomyces sp. NPDC007883 TaxID=3155116 RepID=UPI0033EC3433
MRVFGVHQLVRHDIVDPDVQPVLVVMYGTDRLDPVTQHALALAHTPLHCY